LQLKLPHPFNGLTVIVSADQVRKMSDDEEVVGDNTSDVDEDKTAQTKAAKKAKADAKRQAKKELKAEIAALDGLDKAAWDALYAWRRETALVEDKGEFQVLYDKVMLYIARVRPTDPPTFGHSFTLIEGFGDTKQEQYGKAICTVVQEALEGFTEVSV
jgi:ribonuclease D